MDVMSFMITTSEETIDEQISRLKIELAQKLRTKRQAYEKALKFHEDMGSGKLPKTDKNFIIHDRALVIIRKYKRDNISKFGWGIL